MERGLWGFTQEGQETPPASTYPPSVRNLFRLQSDKPYSLIALSVEKSLQVHIASTTDPLEAWQILQKQFEFISVTQIVHLNRKFYAATMPEGTDLLQHLTYMTSLAEQLREMKEDISPRKFATVALGSLPESYNKFLTSLNARNAEDLDWENIKGVLMEEYMKLKEKNEKQKPDDALFTRKGPNVRGRNHTRGGYFGNSRTGSRDCKLSSYSRGHQEQPNECQREVRGPKCF